MLVAIDRVRSIVGRMPISLERSRIPAVGPLRELPERGQVDHNLRQPPVDRAVPEVGEEWAELARLTHEDAELLGREARGRRFLRTRRLSRDINGQFVEVRGKACSTPTGSACTCIRAVTPVA